MGLRVVQLSFFFTLAEGPPIVFGVGEIKEVVEQRRRGYRPTYWMLFRRRWTGEMEAMHDTIRSCVAINR